jgi:hypothetical protein
MSKTEIALRLENDRMVTLIQQLTLEAAVTRQAAATMEAATRYGEQCDDGVDEPASKPVAFPSRALRFQTQKIGLFTPGG